MTFIIARSYYFILIELARQLQVVGYVGAVLPFGHMTEPIPGLEAYPVTTHVWSTPKQAVGLRAQYPILNEGFTASNQGSWTRQKWRSEMKLWWWVTYEYTVNQALNTGFIGLLHKNSQNRNIFLGKTNNIIPYEKPYVTYRQLDNLNSKTIHYPCRLMKKRDMI